MINCELVNSYCRVIRFRIADYELNRVRNRHFATLQLLEIEL